jgi:hypothetical protein
LPHSPQALLLYFTSVHTPLQTLALVSQHTQALFTQWPLLHWLSWVQVLTVLLLLLDEEVPPAPPLEDEPPALLLPGEELPAFPALLLDELLPALPPLWLLLLELELPPEPARDELLLDPPPPELELDEFSDVPPEDLLPPLSPLDPPPLSELLLAGLAQATSERAAPRIRTESDREGVREEGMVVR